MTRETEYAVAAVLWSILLALPLIWPAAAILTVIWLGIGAYYVARSTTPEEGIAADVAFMVTWPYYWVVEG